MKMRLVNKGTHSNNISFKELVVNVPCKIKDTYSNLFLIIGKNVKNEALAAIDF